MGEAGLLTVYAPVMPTCRTHELLNLVLYVQIFLEHYSENGA
jgi:hypothetical protein